jgi:hypothetical protein
MTPNLKILFFLYSFTSRLFFADEASSDQDMSRERRFYVIMTQLACRQAISATLSSSIFDIILAVSHVAVLTRASGIGLETCILFAKEGANVLMADISAPALEKAGAKLRQLVPSAHKVEIQVSSPAPIPLSKLKLTGLRRLQRSRCQSSR